MVKTSVVRDRNCQTRGPLEENVRLLPGLSRLPSSIDLSARPADQPQTFRVSASLILFTSRAMQLRMFSSV